jgi:hypothetical protein
MTPPWLPRPLSLQVAIVGLLALPACAAPPESGATSETATPSATATLPVATPVAASGGTPIDAAGLSIHLPAGWQPETPSSGMRAAQATIAGSAGPGQLAVFYFGPGGGGGLDANIDRWISQMELAPGASTERQTFAAGALQVTAIDLSGTLKASTIGSFPNTDQPGYRMLAAVVEGPGGPWFLRAVGPEATMAEQREAFFAMLRGAGAGG